MSFVVERDTEVQEWNEQKMLNALLGYSGGRFLQWGERRTVERETSKN